MTTAIQARPPQNFFLKLGEDVPSTIFSFLPYRDLVGFSTASRGAQAIREGAERRIFSQIKIFNRKCWKEYWNAEITDEFDANRIDVKILRQFLKFYYRFITSQAQITTSQAQDGRYPCLIPVVVPHQITIGDETKELGMQELQELVSNPSKGLSSGYTQDTDLSRVYQTTKRTNQASLVVLLNQPFYANYPWSNEFELNPCLRNQGQVELLKNWADQTKIPCEKEPDALSLHTTIFATQAAYAQGDPVFYFIPDTTFRTREFIQNDLNPQAPNIPEEQRRDQMLTQLIRSNSGQNIQLSRLRCTPNPPNNPNTSFAIPIMIKFGAPVAPSTPQPPSFSLTKHRKSFATYHYLMGAAQMLPLIGPLVTYHYIGSLIRGPDAISPEWRKYHKRCHFIGNAITFLAVPVILFLGYFSIFYLIPQIVNLALAYNLGLTTTFILSFVISILYFTVLRLVMELITHALERSDRRFASAEFDAISDERRLQDHRGYQALN